MFQSVDELKALIDAFEDCSLPSRKWNHSAHLAVALWYLGHLPEREATRTFIAGLLRFNHAKGIEPTDRGGYHETLTLFWLTIARRFHQEASARATLVEVTNAFVERYGHNGSLFLEFYSEELIWSWRARQSWTEPDLKPLENALV